MGRGAPGDIRPQPGPQEAALACEADILIYGGAAGGGKTWSLLAEPLRHAANRRFTCVIFRRIVPNITNQGGMWDESRELYPYFGATANNNELSWSFPSGAIVRFAHLQRVDDALNWKGSQIAMIGFDQLEEFAESQFWYMLSRNRSLCGVRPYIRATVNPVTSEDRVGGWVHTLIQWWINPATGYPIQERSGVLRWCLRIGHELTWFDTREAALAHARTIEPDPALAATLPKSLTFIAAKLGDNQILMRGDPSYYANLMALPYVERERLLAGNWNVRPLAGLVFNRAWFNTLSTLPLDCVRWVRYWDKAGTAGGGDWSAGVKIGYSPGLRQYVVGDVVRGQWSALEREQVIRQTASLDGPGCEIGVEQEPGSGGKESAEHTIRNLAGFPVYAERVTGDKLTRASPFAAQVEARNVAVVAAGWTEAYLAELHNFCGAATDTDDQVDASSGAFNRAARRAELSLLGDDSAESPTDEERRALAHAAANDLRDQVLQGGGFFAPSAS